MAHVLRSTTRLVSRQRRTFNSSALCNAAHNFAMPALSPTMTEGNIASWRVKEGDSYAAGDVLLEIETDKATMDVEAQDDGILFKIMQSDGAKAVKVGTRIAVLADEGDDVSSLQVPAEESSASSTQAATKEKSPQEDLKAGIDPERSSESQAEAPPTSKSGSDTSVQSSPDAESPSPTRTSGKAAKQNYPLYPSVMSLLKENGISKGDADSIPATGPSGRLLKGDVLAYLGKIEKNYSADQSKRLEKLGHMDLSNIEVMAPKKAAAPSSQAKEEVTPPLPELTEIAVPISLSAVIATQKRVQDTLGIRLPLSVFVGRASELANQDLPLSKRTPTANDLFNSVLGLDNVMPRSSSGNYYPSIMPLLPSLPRKTSKKADIFDDLVSARPRRANMQPALPPQLVASDGVASVENVFSIVANAGEERRVEAYLSKMKLVLEGEPGRLVI